MSFLDDLEDLAEGTVTVVFAASNIPFFSFQLMVQNVIAELQPHDHTEIELENHVDIPPIFDLFGF